MIDETAGTTDGSPSVSVGMPVYNGAESIAAAIDAVLGQTFPDFELIISDNASTDGTLELCRSAAARDARIRIIQQDVNLGPIRNFAAVLDAARAPLFAFAAADDRMARKFLSETVAALDAAPDAVACAPRTLVHFEDGTEREGRGCGPIAGPGWLRPARYLLNPSENSRFYGLYRTEILREAYLDRTACHAFDWIVSTLTLTRGRHVRSSGVILYRRGEGPEKYLREHLNSTPGILERLFPLARMTRALLFRLSPAQLILAVPALVILNLRQSIVFLAARARGRRD